MAPFLGKEEIDTTFLRMAILSMDSGIGGAILNNARELVGV
jgi:hypothetical protein